MSNENIEFSLQITPQTYERIEKLCLAGGMTRSDLLRKSLALMEVALQNKVEGNHLIIEDKKGNKITEIIGL